MAYGIEKPSDKLLALTELDSNTKGESRGERKKQPLTAAPCSLRFLLSQFQLLRPPARAVSDLVNQAYALTPAEITLMWQTAPPRMPIPPRAT